MHVADDIGVDSFLNIGSVESRPIRYSIVVFGFHGFDHPFCSEFDNGRRSESVRALDERLEEIVPLWMRRPPADH